MDRVKMLIALKNLFLNFKWEFLIKLLPYLYEFWFWSTLRSCPFFLQLIDGLGIPVASQARVVWTFTVTVTLVGPRAIDGGTKWKLTNKRET